MKLLWQKNISIEVVVRTLQDIMENYNIPFGGKLNVFGGDFRQVLPVVPKGTRAQTVEACLVTSYLWPIMEKLYLNENMRATNDTEFCTLLMKIGNGTQPYKIRDMISLPRDMIIDYEDEKIAKNKLIDITFPLLEEKCHCPKYIIERAILETKKEFVDDVNEIIIKKFPRDEYVYYSFNCAMDETKNTYQPEFLNSITPNGMPPHKLVLKKNCPVILLRNLVPANGLCNGTCLVCMDFQKNVIHAKVATGQYDGREVLLPRIPCHPKEIESYPFIFKRKQFPIRLSFTMTVNKAQGQTIPYVGIYLPEPVFSHGQLYVALSRGISRSSTRLLIKPTSDDCLGCTKNIVYSKNYGGKIGN